MGSRAARGRRLMRVAMVWNQTIHGEHILTEPTPVILGYGPQALFPLPESQAAGGDITLLVPSLDSWVLHLPEGAGGAVWLDGRRREVREMRSSGSSVALGPRDYGVLNLGPVSVFFQQVAPASEPARRLMSLDGDSVAALGLSLFLHVALLLLMLLAWRESPPEETLELPKELISRFLVTPPPEDILKQLRGGDETVDPGLRQRDEGGGKKRKGDEGRVGERDSKREKTELAGENHGKVVAKVRGMGLLGALAGGDALSQALDAPAVGDILSGLGAVSTAVGRGSRGAGLRGVGRGGGGDAASGLFGAGKLGTGVGAGRGGGGRGRGGPGARGKPRREAKVTVRTGKPKVSGYLSAEQIRRVVLANQAALRYCYENELQRNRNLKGKVTLQWRVDLRGRVSTARVAKSTLRNARAEGCMVRQVRKWRFPKPDGGSVAVMYPFLFGVGG